MEELCDRQCVVLLLPVGSEVDLVRQMLRQEMWRRSMVVERLYLPELQSSDGPVAALGEALHPQWPSTDCPHTLDNLLRCRGLPDLIFLEGLTALGSGRLPAWLRFLGEWHRACRSVSDSAATRPALCVFGDAAGLVLQVVSASAQLPLRWWFGVPSALEVRLLCRMGAAEGDERAASTWREHVLPSVVGNDLVFADALWDPVCLPLGALLTQMAQYALARGWPQERLRAWGAAKLAARGASPRTGGRLAPEAHYREGDDGE